MKIDTNSIPNFDAMTADEKVSALLAFDYDDGSEKLKSLESDVAKWKAASDKSSSEAAAYKKQLNAKMTDDERKQQESEAALKAMQDKLAEYEMRDKFTAAQAKFLGAGFDEQAAETAAKAFTDGDLESLATALKGFKSSVETGLKAKLIDDTPRPEGGGKADATPDYTKLYEEAVRAGNMPEAASYIRLAQQQNAT